MVSLLVMVFYSIMKVSSGENFLTRKVTKFVAKYSINKSGILYLGNIDAYRDWGYAPDFVEGI